MLSCLLEISHSTRRTLLVLVVVGDRQHQKRIPWEAVRHDFVIVLWIAFLWYFQSEELLQRDARPPQQRLEFGQGELTELGRD